MTSCTYFESQDWKNRIKSAINDEWDIFDALDRCSKNYGQRKVKNYLEDRGHHLGEDSIWQAISLINTAGYTINREEVIEEWHSENNIPKTCSHHPENGRYCKYHTASTGSITEPSLESAEANSGLMLIGARGDRLSITDTTFENHSIEHLDLRYANVDLVSIEGLTVRKDLQLDGTVGTTITLSDSEIRGDVSLINVEAQQVKFEASDFRGSLNLRDATLDTKLFLKGVTVGSSTWLNGLTIGSEDKLTELSLDSIRLTRAQHGEPQIELLDCVFKGRFQCTESDSGLDTAYKPMLCDVRCNGTVFEGTFELSADIKGADFGGTIFKRDVLTSNTKFTGPLLFNNEGELDSGGQQKRQNTWIGPAEFKSRTVFADIECGNPASFAEVTFDGKVKYLQPEFICDVSFSEASFKDVEFKNPTFRKEASFQKANFGTLCLNQVKSSHSPPLVDLSYSSIDSGVISKGTDSSLPYESKNNSSGLSFPYLDLSDAKIGNLSFDIDAPGSIFELINLRSCSYNGFRFHAYHEELEGSWNLYKWKLDDSAETPPSEAVSDLSSRVSRYVVRAKRFLIGPKSTSIEDLYTFEQTHLLAQNGAENVGDDHGASEFFLQRMKARRWYVTRQLLRISSQSKTEFTAEQTLARSSWLRLLSLWCFDLSCGYGERPLRAFLMSLATILSFGVLYSALGAFGNVNWLEGIVMSFQIFVTLIFGSTIAEQATLPIRFLASFEGFTGAFFIALFVFSLTQSLR